MDPEKTYYRFTVLFFNCMLTFGSYYCFDMPSVLQSRITGTNNCTINGTDVSQNTSCCSDCLGMSEDSYNLLYAIYAWTNAVVVIFAGVLIDKLGNRFGVFLFSSLCLIGSSVFAGGAMLAGGSHADLMLPVMLFGRLIFGAGNGSLTIVQNRVTAFWFRNRELALAFGLTLAFSRLGSVLNFFFTENLAMVIHLQATLWLGAGLCGLGFVSAALVALLDTRGVARLGLTASLAAQSRRIRLTDLTRFSLPFWLLVLAICFYYNGVFPFVADASQFIQEKYGFAPTTSSYLAGAVYDVSMVLSPFLGGVIDVFGKRGYLALATALFTIPVFGVLAFTEVYPLVATLWLGVTYSFAAACLWPSIPLVVPQAMLGTAMGIATSVQMIGIGVCNEVVGLLLSHGGQHDTLLRWKYVMIFLLGNVLACVATTAVVNVVDRRRDRVLNQSREEKLAKEAVSFDDEDEDEEVDERSALLGSQRSEYSINN